MRSARRQLESALEGRAPSFALIGLWPGLARVAYAPAYLGSRGLAVYVVAKTLFWFGLIVWAGPALGRWVAHIASERAALGDALGREPSEDEFLRHLAQARRRRRRARHANRR